jgi:phage terminase small subunit
MESKDIPVDIRKAISSIEIVEEYDGTGKNRKLIGYTKKIRFWDKNRALENLGKHFGIFSEDNRQRVESLADFLKDFNE